MILAIACTAPTAVPAWGGLQWDRPLDSRLEPYYELWWRIAPDGAWSEMARLDCGWQDYCDDLTGLCSSAWLCPGESEYSLGPALVGAPPLRYGDSTPGILIDVTPRAVGCRPIPCTENLKSPLPSTAEEVYVPATGANVARVCWPGIWP